MGNSYTQDKRIGNFTTPFGKDELVLRRFDGVEGLSELFEFRIEAIGKRSSYDFDAAIGKHCSLAMRTIAGEPRLFDGILTEVQLIEFTLEGPIFELTLRPWLWLLSKRSNCLIFHRKTAPQIISEIFGEHAGLAVFELALTKDYPEIEYCVQYRESDLAFVCRLMEQHGIGFHFRYAKGRHTLILGDDLSAYRPIPGGERPYIRSDQRHNRDTEHFFEWIPERRFTTGKVTLKDFDFKRPSANLLAERPGDARYEHGQLEAYDYPGKYVQEGHGRSYAEWRLNSRQAADHHALAEGDCLSCAPGHLVALTGAPAGLGGRYLASRCVHTFQAEAYRSSEHARNASYQGRYEFLRSERPFAPPVVTEKPFVQGPQTATVVGDGEIDCDEHGRILVRFHWDRKNDQSMRVRVAQVWASQQWGGIFLPRVGMEVIVNFLEGDPDQPIVAGCVYNGDNRPPYDLPGSKNIAGWKSNSTPGGSGYNEFVMDDTAKSELVRLHAQKDLDSKVENDERREVIKDRETKIGVDDTLEVGQELFVKAGTKITLMVGSSTIEIDPMSIKLTSKNIQIDAGMLFQSKSGLLSTHEAGTVMTITGAMVKIN